MNATERARRSDSLYYDTQVTNRRALCDMIANRESDLTESKAENAKLRELARGLHMAYVGALNECESMDAGLIWNHCEMVDAELAKSHARFEADRHRFDVAMSELGIEVDG